MIDPRSDLADTDPTTPAGALAELLAGNQRFVDGVPLHPNQDAERRAAVADVQHPFAVVLGCSDSRLAAEIIFDRGLGDLFVVRTAGHVLGVEVLGSIEYAVDVLDIPLVLVLGHSSCGAVRAAHEAVTEDTWPTGNLLSLVEAVVPSVVMARREGTESIDDMVDVHVRRIAGQLPGRSEVLSDAVAAGRCAVAGMSYQLGDGRVSLLTGAAG